MRESLPSNMATWLRRSKMKTQEAEFVCKYNREILEDADQEHDAVAEPKRYGQYERSGKSMIELPVAL
jgi:hypothetical protein